MNELKRLKRPLARFVGRLTYANVMVTLLAFLVLAGGAAIAKKKGHGKATKADLGVLIAGPTSTSLQPGDTTVVHTVQVTNNGPGKAQPVVFVGGGGRVNVGDVSVTGQTVSHVLSTARLAAAPGCTQTGPTVSFPPRGAVPASAVSYGTLVCKGPALKKGATASFPVTYSASYCSGDGTLTTTAVATSGLVDPKSTNDTAAKATALDSGGCG
ncbi:MAG: hypothetical protein QOD60_1659 [Solirubrobacterales bacterium]|jgi:hypothetical protein|nr:hypothetical protein [Solirubrobacterales bacterium]